MSRAAGRRPAGPKTGWDALTETERRVAALLAEGRPVPSVEHTGQAGSVIAGRAPCAGRSPCRTAPRPSGADAAIPRGNERLPARSVVVAIHLEVRETVVDVGVANEEVEADPRSALAEDVIGSGDHLHAVDVALDDVADDARLDDVAVLDAILRAGELGQRGEVPDLPVPPHDLRVAVGGLQAPEEHLVPGAAVWLHRAAQAYLDLLEVLVGRVPAEHLRA